MIPISKDKQEWPPKSYISLISKTHLRDKTRSCAKKLFKNIEYYTSMPQPKVAKLLGVGITTLQQAYRSLNLGRWPQHIKRTNKASIKNIILSYNLPETYINKQTKHFLLYLINEQTKYFYFILRQPFRITRTKLFEFPRV